MAGFATYDKGGGVPGTTVYADNVDFTGLGRTNTITTNGQLLIGSTAPNAGGNNINVGQITSPSGTLQIGFSTPNITMDLIGGFADLHTAKWIVNQAAGQGGNSTTIQNAINNAVSGETIAIFPGTYTENLTLKAGVNLTAWGSDSSLNTTGKVIINGTCTMNTAGTVTIYGIQLQTNSAALLAVTGSAASIVNLNNCFLNCLNNTGITFSAANTSAQIMVFNCNGNLATTGIALFAHTSTGTLTFNQCKFTNSGGSSTASTASAGTVVGQYSLFANPITTSSTNTFAMGFCQLDTVAQNVTALTCGGSGANIFNQGRIGSGSASAVSVATTVTLALLSSIIISSNTNAITGLGTLTFSDIVFEGTSSIINTSTNTAVPVAKIYAIRGITFDNTNVLSVYQRGTFTPVLAFGGSTTGFVYATQLGQYTVIGNLVIIAIDITLTTKGSGTGNVTLSGLPVASGNNGTSVIPITQITPMTLTGNTSTALSIDLSATTGTFLVLTQATGGSAVMTTTNATFSNNTTVRLQGYYYTS